MKGVSNRLQLCSTASALYPLIDTLGCPAGLGACYLTCLCHLVVAQAWGCFDSDLLTRLTEAKPLNKFRNAALSIRTNIQVLIDIDK